MGMVLNISEPALDYVLYGNKSNFFSNYITQQLQQIKPTFNEFSNRIYQTLQNSYDFINNKLTQYGIVNQLANSGLQVMDNYIMPLMSFTELQQANLTMQRWIICHPEVKQLYVNQDIDGYSESYKNIFGKEVGEEDYNYRRATDGLLTSTDDYWVVKHYIDDLLPGDRELENFEKFAISHTHDTIDYILSTCKFDFTCTSKTPPKINRS